VVSKRTERPLPPPLSLSEREREDFVDADDGTRIYFRSVGEGPAVVLCDGIMCEGFVWKYLRPLLARSHRVIHWNYRGHGRSGRPRDLTRVGILDHARDLWRVLDAAGVDRAVLMGHSMGTQVCLEGYRAEPTRTAGLVLMCGSYGRITRTFHGTDALAKALPYVRALREQYPRLVRALFAYTPTRLVLQSAKLLREIDPVRIRAEDMLPYFEHLAMMDPDVYLRMLEAAGLHSAEDLLRTVRTPTLVIAAERDSFTPPRLAAQMADQIEGAQYLLVREGSHAVPIEQPEPVNDAVLRFLATHAAPALDERDRAAE
jgi:pimeloyl-ACP methyl ester carboxylesterase